MLLVVQNWNMWSCLLGHSYARGLFATAFVRGVSFGFSSELECRIRLAHCEHVCFISFADREYYEMRLNFQLLNFPQEYQRHLQAWLFSRSSTGFCYIPNWRCGEGLWIGPPFFLAFYGPWRIRFFGRVLKRKRNVRRYEWVLGCPTGYKYCRIEEGLVWKLWYAGYSWCL